jgi:hypothetical protein
LAPEDLAESEFFAKLFPIELAPRNLIGSGDSVYLFFSTSTEKEDWFLRLMFASRQVHLDWPMHSPSYFHSMMTSVESCSMHDERWLSSLAERLFEIEFARQTIHERFHAIIEQRLKRFPKTSIIV